MSSQDFNGDLILCGLIFVGIYMFAAALFEHHKVRFLHQTGLAILIGFLIGTVVYFAFNDFFNRLVNFNETIVFFVLLPPMLFSSGFNLKKRRFFQNMYYINIYGFVGTILNFMVIAGLTYLVSFLGLIRDWSNSSSIRYLSSWQILLFSACMCSMDPIASLTEIKPEYSPKLFSIIFGQSLMKDSITIVLFKSLFRLIVVNGTVDQFSFEWYTSFIILGTFFVQILASVLIGVIYAFIWTLIFKKFRFILHDQGVTEVGLIFICGYVSYLTSEIIGFSGVITMLFCGIFLAHFNIYNMSPQGVQASKVTFKSISLLAQGLLFVLLGLSTWQVKSDSEEGYVVSESWTFILLSLIILGIARFVNIFVVNAVFRLIKGKDKWRVNIYELQMIYVAGIVKGAVPFALTTSFPTNSSSFKVTTLIVKSTIIIIVFLTSLFGNGMIPMFIRNRTQTIKEKLRGSDPSLFDSLIEKQNLAESEESKKFKSDAQKYWKKFDQGVLKPLLIFNYAGRRDEIREHKKLSRKEELGIEVVKPQHSQHIENSINVQDEEHNKFIEINKQGKIASDSEDSDEEDKKLRMEQRQSRMTKKIEIKRQKQLSNKEKSQSKNHQPEKKENKHSSGNMKIKGQMPKQIQSDRQTPKLAELDARRANSGIE